VTTGFAESHVEKAALAWLSELGYISANGLDIGPDGDKPERASYGDVLLIERLRKAIAKPNPTINADTRTDALSQLLQTQTPSLIAENRRLHRFLVEGVPVQVRLGHVGFFPGGEGGPGRGASKSVGLSTPCSRSPCIGSPPASRFRRDRRSRLGALDRR
jgi:hypothetical protein